MPYLRFEIKCLFSYVSERTSFSRTMLRLFPADKTYSQFESYESYKIESIVKWLAASLLVCVTLMTIKTTSRTTQLGSRLVSWPTWLVQATFVQVTSWQMFLSDWWSSDCIQNLNYIPESVESKQQYYKSETSCTRILIWFSYKWPSTPAKPSHGQAFFSCSKNFVTVLISNVPFLGHF